MCGYAMTFVSYGLLMSLFLGMLKALECLNVWVGVFTELQHVVGGRLAGPLLVGREAWL